MLTYIGRRVLYSIPVILIATFFAFWAVRTTFDPTAHIETVYTRLWAEPNPFTP